MTSSPAHPPAPWLAELRATLDQKRAALAESLPAPGHAVPLDEAGIALGRRHARALDEVLVTLFDHVGAAIPGAAAVAIGGVGGYGRGAVALRSDLDVRLLIRDTKDPAGRARAAELAEALLYPLWDLGVSVGHQVVTVDELVEAARTDLPTATSLLDFRRVAGDPELAGELRKRAAEGLFAHSELPSFLARLEDECAQRHGRFGGSVYLLEPDVRNGEGGLRDVDVARWAAKARFGVGEPDELVRLGVLVAREAAAIVEARELCWRIRNLLHLHAGRRSDRLTFDEQELIAELLGHGEGGEAVERFMSGYYLAARAISRARETMLARAAPVLSRRKPRDEDLGRGVRLFDGLVTVGEPEQLRADPALSLRVVAAAVERGAAILPYARDAVARAAADPAFGEALRKSPEAARLFVDVWSSCRETALKSGSVRKELHDLGLLLAMIPEFSPVVGRVHHDTYHVYTVDVHSVAAAERLATLIRGDLAAEFPMACRLAAEIARPKVLFFATLLHDVGKAIGGTDHSRRGAEMAKVILARLGFSPDDVEAAAHLIERHLVMYLVATRRDLDDPLTIAELSREVRGREGLRDLYLLTVADLSTTSPTSMTSWKARMLDELFLATDALLAEGELGPHEGKSEGADQRVSRAVAEVLAAADEHGGGEGEEARGARRDRVRAYLASMPERYLLAHPAAAVAAHAELAQAARGAGEDGDLVRVALVPSRRPEAAEICVVAPDRPGLLAAITAAIAASRLEVHAAEIHSRRLEGGAVQAVDLFWVRDRGEGAGAVARALPKLARDLERALGGEVLARELARNRGGGSRLERSSPKVEPQVALDDRASPRHTVLEVVARDRPGLLFALSDALHALGLGIAVAKINTEGSRVADVFYVSERDGSKITPGRRAAEVQARLLDAIEGLERG